MIPSRGFVLSFSTFALALMLVIVAQVHHTHLLFLQTDSVEVYQTTTPARALRDISLDLNALIGQTIRIDQNQDRAFFTLSGKMPNALSMQTNLLRYQTNLFYLGRDSNASIFIDLNQTISDGNLWGRTNHGMRWRERLDENSLRVFPTDSNYYPQMIDVNIFSEIPYESFTPTISVGGGFIFTFFSLNYTDTNIDHNYSTGVSFMTSSGSFTLNLVYDVNGTNHTKFISIGNTDPPFSGSSFGTTITGAPSVPWTYSITYNLPNDRNGTRAGYDFNTTVRGVNFRADTNTIWSYGG